MVEICLRGFDGTLFRRLRPCNEWTGGTIHGYGRYYIAGNKSVLVHREALARRLGRSIDPGYLACHHCDNPPCYELEHLYEGNRSDNVQDMHDRGRHPNSSPVLKRTLTPDQESEIRARYRTEDISQMRLAAEYGVSQRTISTIVRLRPPWRTTRAA